MGLRDRCRVIILVDVIRRQPFPELLHILNFESCKEMYVFLLYHFCTLMIGWHNEQDKKSKRTVVTQLNVITLLANVVVMLNKPEAVDLIMPLFAESLAEGDASAPGLMRLKVKFVPTNVLVSDCIWLCFLHLLKTI